MTLLEPLKLLVAFLILLILLGSLSASLRGLRRILEGVPVFPDRDIGPEPRSTGDALYVLAIWLGLNVSVGVFHRVLADDSKQETLSPLQMMGFLAVVNGFLVLMLPFFLDQRSGGRFRYALLNGRSLGHRVYQGFLGCLVIMPLVYLVNIPLILITRPVGHPMAKMVESEFSLSTALLAILSGGLLAPAAEELMFRGVVLPWLANARKRPSRDAAPELPPATDADQEIHLETPATDTPDPVPDTDPLNPPTDDSRAERDARDQTYANILTSGLFALIHLPQWPAPVPIFVLSMALGNLYMRTGSLVAAIAMHATFNLFSTLVLFFSQLNAIAPS